MWPNKDTDEPDWVRTEREQFSNYRDKNGDGKMDSSEVKHWILPPNYDHSEAEAKHLLVEADLNEVCYEYYYTELGDIGMYIAFWLTFSVQLHACLKSVCLLVAI